MHCPVLYGRERGCLSEPTDESWGSATGGGGALIDGDELHYDMESIEMEYAMGITET